MAEYIVTVEEDSKNFEEMFIGAIRSYPKLIRCKDCKHYMNEDENCPDEYGNCPTVCMYMPDDAEENGYCHRAERKEES